MRQMRAVMLNATSSSVSIRLENKNTKISNWVSRSAIFKAFYFDSMKAKNRQLWIPLTTQKGNV